MKRFSLFLMGLAAIALGHTPAVRAEDPGISFDPHWQADVPDHLAEGVDPLANQQKDEGDVSGPLGLPPTATKPPVQPFSLAKENELPPPPPQPESLLPEVASALLPAVPTQAASNAPAPDTNLPPAESVASSNHAPVELNFPPATTTATSEHQTAAAQASEVEAVVQEVADQTAHLPTITEANFTLDKLFQGGSDSLVARIVGSAEGTRTAEGLRTRAYYGHTDPGNGVWNLGSFSYQHGASSPEEADEKQLKRLRGQTDKLSEIASRFQIEMTLEEKLNGIDLANQSPKAALSRGGYVERLADARNMNLQGEEAILWARVRSYIDPDTQRWNAPGLGNNLNSITHDQDRRMRAIARALESFQQESALLAQQNTQQNSFPSQASLPPQDSTTAAAPDSPSQTERSQSEERRIDGDRPLTNLLASVVDQLIGLDLSQS